MTDVRPFRGLRYDPSRVDLARVLAPPYDVIGDPERAALYQRDPHNAVRLELGRDARDEGEETYAAMARALAAWEAQGILRRDARPGLYLLRQRFRAPDGAPLLRDGFFALLRLEDYERGVVRPHERTLAAPKADRLKALRATRANTSSVFLLFEDREHELARALAPGYDSELPPFVRDDAGVEHALGAVHHARSIRAVQEFLAKRPVVIADGHHRYETALTHRDEQRAKEPGAGPDAPFEWVLAYFANACAPGSLVLPIHRVVRRGPPPDDAAWAARLPGWSQRQERLAGGESLEASLARLLAPLRDCHAFAADDGSGVLRVFSRPRDAQPGELTVRLLHREVLAGVFGLEEAEVREGAVAFPKSAREAAQAVRSGLGAVALYLNPLTADDVFRVTAAGERLPQKSTLFHPKLPTGLVFRTLGGDGG